MSQVIKSQPITSAFNARSTALEVVAGHDLSQRVALVTGGSSGIGVETAKALLSAGSEVILAVRDLEKGEKVAQELRNSVQNARVSLLKLDLGRLESVREAAAAFLSQHSSLHTLINNAGIMATPHNYTPDGFESQFGTNHLGHFLLTNLLLPVLKNAASARVVALSSTAHLRSDIHWDDVNYRLRPYDKWDAYAQSKTANALFAVSLNQKFSSEGIHAFAVHPGGIMTGLQKELPQAEMQAMGWLDADGKPISVFKSVQQGASTSVWAAVGSELEGNGGLYLEDCRQALSFDPAQPYAGVKSYALDLESAARLWTLSEEMVGLK
ncbi:MAG: SDR family NAD(P)-dependent oxidoreductase [Pseudopedobacter sp.]|nr:SDR family NAD(P)-dependent oxidoreductase [Deinococcales bacterium]